MGLLERPPVAPPLQQIRRILADVSAGGAFAARVAVPADDLDVEVRGVGPLRLPITDAQARALCAAARPAHYGKGEHTLLDRSVRDSWEIPANRLRIDRKRWDRTLLPAVDALRRELGLPEGRRLVPELHNLLVYGPGQFFLPHQDSEKVGTLVVTPAPPPV